MIDNRLVVCAVASVIAHYALARGLEHLPKRVDHKDPAIIQIRLSDPPKQEPPPEPPKEEPKPDPKPEPKPEPKPIPHAQPTHAPMTATVPKDTPAPDHPAVTTDTTDEPVYGYDMSNSSATGGPAVPVGNTTKVAPGEPAKAPVKALAQPVAAAEATKLPLPQGRCIGKYTDEARTAGVEGTVVLDLVVGEDGSVREVSVSSGLPHGLTEAAVAALKACKFSPGERDGKPVPVRVRGFKIHFVLDQNQ